MPTFLASTVGILLPKGRWRDVDPEKKSDRVQTCSSIVQTGVRDHDQSPSPNPTGSWRTIEEWKCEEPRGGAHSDLETGWGSKIQVTSDLVNQSEGSRSGCSVER